jgi:hypothetical protein
MKTMDFDRIATSAPLDRQASVARDGSGDLWEAKIPDFHPHWDTPPLPEKPMPGGTPDLSGMKVGRMVVVRFHRTHHKRGAQWLVRCSCGAYELRQTSAVKKTDDPDHCCYACQRVNNLRKRAASPATMARRKADEALLDSFAKGRANA